MYLMFCDLQFSRGIQSALPDQAQFESRHRSGKSLGPALLTAPNPAPAGPAPPMVRTAAPVLRGPAFLRSRPAPPPPSLPPPPSPAPRWSARGPSPHYTDDTARRGRGSSTTTPPDPRHTSTIGRVSSRL